MGEKILFQLEEKVVLTNKESKAHVLKCRITPSLTLTVPSIYVSCLFSATVGVNCLSLQHFGTCFSSQTILFAPFDFQGTLVLCLF